LCQVIWATGRVDLTLKDAPLKMHLTLKDAPQNQALLDALHPSTLIIPLTTNLVEEAEPLRIRIKAREGVDRDSDLLTDQIRAIGNKRLIQGPLLQLDDDFMQLVCNAVCEVMGMEV
jgi:mRNA interferase MazF